MANIGAQASPHGWSITAATNGNQSPPDGFGPNQNPNQVDPWMRETMRAIRTWYNDAGWIEYGVGDQGYAAAFVSGTSFTIGTTDLTAEYCPNRRVRITAPTPGTIYGTITASVFTTTTTVTVVWDSGVLANEAITSVFVGIIRGSSILHSSFPNVVFPGGGITAINSSNVEVARFNSTGLVMASGSTVTGLSQVYLGTATALNTVTGNLQVASTGSGSFGAFARFSADALGAGVSFAKSRGATVGTQTAVVANDALALVTGFGSDGTNFVSTAQMVMEVDGAVSTGIVPSRVRFITTTGGGVAFEAMRMTAAQQVLINQPGLIGGSNAALQVAATAGNGEVQITEYSNDAAAPGVILVKSRSTSYNGVTAVTLNDELGVIATYGTDGTGYVLSSAINMWVDGAVSSGIVPSRIVFNTMNLSGTLVEAARFTYSQQFLVGTPGILTAPSGVTTHGVQIGMLSKPGILIARYGNDTAAAQIVLAKSRGAAVGTETVVQVGDTLGLLTVTGSDGTNEQISTQIQYACDGAPSAGVVPGRMVLATTNASGTLVEAMRIRSDQAICFSPAIGPLLPATTTTAGVTWGPAAPQFNVSNSTGQSAGTAVCLIQHNAATITASAQFFNFFRQTTNIGGISGSSNIPPTFFGASDARMKEQVKPATGIGAVIDKLNPVYFKMKADVIEHGDYADTLLGLIAQDVQPVWPVAVVENGLEGDMLGLSYERFVPVLIAALKETRAELAALKAEVAALKEALKL